ncbi:hypothetical protein C8Q79DRAFT_59524 [Trametes meyenii]|nr:hypothetical protein C8Q79DRAFT_59524 [Trametes meyenii]
MDTVLSEALSLSSRARQLDARGSYGEAEQLLYRAIELVEPCTPPSETTVAALWNSLGELYLHMGRLDDAERWLNKSLDLSVATREFKEIASTRETLARISQIRGELLKAKALRMLGAPDDMRCGYHGCRRGLLRTPNLRICGGCKGVFYCSGECQTSDWEDHSNHCRRSFS